MREEDMMLVVQEHEEELWAFYTRKSRILSH